MPLRLKVAPLAVLAALVIGLSGCVSTSGIEPSAKSPKALVMTSADLPSGYQAAFNNSADRPNVTQGYVGGWTIDFVRQLGGSGSENVASVAYVYNDSEHAKELYDSLVASERSQGGGASTTKQLVTCDLGERCESEQENVGNGAGRGLVFQHGNVVWGIAIIVQQPIVDDVDLHALAKAVLSRY